MSALLLSLSLWHAPALPVYAAQLHLAPLPRLSLGALTPPPLVEPEPELDPVPRLLGEALGGMALYLVGQALVAGAEAALVLAVDALNASSPGGAVLIVVAVALFLADLSGGPFLFAEGARVTAGLMGAPHPSLGRSVPGAYIGAGVGAVLWVLAVGLFAALDTTAGVTPAGSSFSPLALVAIIASVAFPIGGGIGASIGLHWKDHDPPEAEPAPAVPPLLKPAPPAVLPPDQPPPQAGLRSRLPAVTLLTLAFD